MSSDWPIDRIWEENLQQDVAEIDISKYSGCNLLIYRYNLQVQVINLSFECFMFLTALKTGKCITDAWLYTLENQQAGDRPDIDENDITGIFGYLLSLDIFTENSHQFNSTN